MRQSVLRIVFALLITAVGASLLIGTVSAQGPVPQEPPKVAEPPPIGGLPTKENPEILDVRRTVTIEEPSTLVVTDASLASMLNVAMSTTVTIQCARVTHEIKKSNMKFETKLRYCWNTSDPPYLITKFHKLTSVFTYDGYRQIKEQYHRHGTHDGSDKGGVGKTFFRTKGKLKFCRSVGKCPGFDNFEIDGDYRINGVVYDAGRYYFEWND